MQSPWTWFDKFKRIISEVGSKNAIMIILSSFAGLLVLWFLLFMLMTFYWLEMMVMVLRKLKECLKTQFVIKDMSKPRYFFDIEIVYI